MKFFSVLVLFCYSISLYAQEDLTDKDFPGASSITLGTDYSSNTNTFGHFNNFVTQPSFTPSFNYFGKKGLFFSGLVNFIGNSDSTNTKTTTEFDLQAGYRWDINDHFSLSPSYTHYFYSANSSSLKSEFSDYAQLDLNAEFKWWYASVSSGYVLGSTNEFILMPQAGINFQWDHFIFNTGTLSVRPSFMADFSNQNYFNLYYRKRYVFLKPFLNKYPDATVGEFLSDYDKGMADLPKITKLYFTKFFTNHPNYLAKMRKLPADVELRMLSELSSSTKFTCTNIGLSLPVTYTLGNFTLNFNLSFYKPINQPVYIDSDWISFTTFGISYSFNLGK